MRRPGSVSLPGAPGPDGSAGPCVPPPAPVILESFWSPAEACYTKPHGLASSQGDTQGHVLERPVSEPSDSELGLFPQASRVSLRGHGQAALSRLWFDGKDILPFSRGVA